MRVILSQEAERDLEEIWRYTRRHWGVEKAMRYTGMIETAAERLATNPHLGSSCHEIAPDYRKLAADMHTPYYRIMGEEITIIRILDQRMDAPEQLQ
jgi:toxin ParE1/3/4